MDSFSNPTHVNGIKIESGVYKGEGCVYGEWVFPCEFFNNDGIARSIRYDEREVTMVFIFVSSKYKGYNTMMKGQDLTGVEVSATIENYIGMYHVATNVVFTIAVPEVSVSLLVWEYLIKPHN